MGGGQWHKISRGITEAEDLPKKVLDDAEKFVKELKPKKAEFVKRYGAKAKSVMYATAMNMAKKKHGIGEQKKYGSIINQIKIIGWFNNNWFYKIHNEFFIIN